MVKLVLIVCVAVAAVNCIDVKRYLQQYGYYHPNSYDQSNLKDSIETFQKTFRLPVTGVVDAATKKLMNTPRCGLPDHGIRGNAYADTKWKKNSLTYYFHNYSSRFLFKSRIEAIIAKAFSYWSAVADLKFTKGKDDGDINIAFGLGRHADDVGLCHYPFDGKGGTLAHAFFPPTGRLHFDDGENWTDKTFLGQNLLATAVHEIGHILGLEHDTSTKSSIMYPTAKPYNLFMKLHKNDIDRIQKLYGRRKKVSGFWDDDDRY